MVPSHSKLLLSYAGKVNTSKHKIRTLFYNETSTDPALDRSLSSVQNIGEMRTLKSEPWVHSVYNLDQRMKKLIQDNFPPSGSDSKW